jgi:hypothetical protein
VLDPRLSAPKEQKPIAQGKAKRALRAPAAAVGNESPRHQSPEMVKQYFSDPVVIELAAGR